MYLNKKEIEALNLAIEALNSGIEINGAGEATEIISNMLSKDRRNKLLLKRRIG